MKVFLINPNRSYEAGGASEPTLGLPLGLLYIASSLEQQGIQVSLLDCLLSPQTRLVAGSTITLGVAPEVLRAALQNEAPGMVGISCQFTAQWDNVLDAIQIVKSTLPGCVLVLGGPHATVCAAEILAEHSEVDFVLAGEGEVSFPGLVKALEIGDLPALRGIPGLAWRGDDGAIHRNPVEAINDLDALPLPAYHLVDFDCLYRRQSEGLSARGNLHHAVSVITSRGCPYSCTFCSIRLSMGQRWRAHSAAFTIQHIKLLEEKYGVRHIHIEDDNFTFKQSRAEEICRGLIAAGSRITWDTPNGVRADRLTEEMLDSMKASGCISLSVAAESGDQYVLDTIIKKKLDLKCIERAAALAYRRDIDMKCFFVIGFPGETKQQIQRTLRFAASLYFRYRCFPLVMVATPLPGTELAAIAQQKGYLVREMTPANLARATSPSGLGMLKTPEFDPEYLRRSCTWFYRRCKVIRIYFLLTHARHIVRALRRRMHPRAETSSSV